MPLVFAAITPHPPLLLPNIGKETLSKLENTKKALEKLEEDLYLSKPDVIIVISPHGNLIDDAFTINIATDFKSDFKEFGDFVTTLTFHSEISLASTIREAGTEKSFPIVLTSEQTIDHGVSIPLHYLTQHLPAVSILPIGFSSLDTKTHLDFGAFLKDHIMQSSKRVAVVASADLSHALTVDAPAQFHAEGPEFDQKIQELLTTKNTDGISSLEPNFISNAKECGFRSILILLGMLRDINYTYTPYAYEAPFGVGYLTANFSF